MQNETSLETIDYPSPFDEAAAELCRDARRYVAIMSPELDPAAFDSDAFADALRKLLLESAQSEVRILVQTSAGLLGRGHRLLQLARRMPSRVHIRRLGEHPEWEGETVIVCDRNSALFKPAGSVDKAFREVDVRPTAERKLELFDNLWRYSEEDPDLRALAI